MLLSRQLAIQEAASSRGGRIRFGRSIQVPVKPARAFCYLALLVAFEPALRLNHICHPGRLRDLLPQRTNYSDHCPEIAWTPWRGPPPGDRDRRPSPLAE